MKIITIPSNNYKKKAEDTAVELLASAYNFHRGALEVKAIAQYLIMISDIIKNDKTLKEMALDEVYEGVLVAGATVSTQETNTTYSYDDNEVWCDYTKKIEALKAERKELQEKIKAATKSSTKIEVNEDTGELINANPVSVSSKTTAIVSIK